MLHDSKCDCFVADGLIEKNVVFVSMKTVWTNPNHLWSTHFCQKFKVHRRVKGSSREVKVQFIVSLFR